MKRKRRNHQPEFKAKVALEAFKGISTAGEISQKFEVHTVQVSNWKKTLMEGASQLFETGNSRSPSEDLDREIQRLRAKVGELTMELDWLKKKSKDLCL